MNIVVAHHGPLMTGRAYDSVLFRQCHALAGSGHHVTFFFGRTTRDEGELYRYYGRERVAGLELVQLPMLRRRSRPRISWNAIFYWSCRRALGERVRRGEVDVLYTRGVRLTAYLMRRLGSACPPVVFEIHNIADPEPASPNARLSETERFVFGRAAGLLSTTDTLGRIVQRLGGLEDVPVKIPHAADAVGETSLRPETKRRNVTYVGQMYPLQGVEVVLEGLRRLTDCDLHLVGGSKEDIERLRGVAGKLEVGGRVVFHGHVAPAEVAGFMRRAEVLVLPSRDAGRMGVVAHTKLYEYLAAGRPIVAVDLPSIAEELTDGVDAVLVRPDDGEAFGAGIRRVLDDYELAGRLAQEARRKGAGVTGEARTQRWLEGFRRVVR